MPDPKTSASSQPVRLPGRFASGAGESQQPTVPEPLAGGEPTADRSREASSGSAEAESLDTFPAGAMLADRYRIVSFLGRGGMGEVYRADDLTLDQPVALKFLPEPKEGDRKSLAHLLDEVKIARRISHPNVCRVHDVGEAEGRHFLSMEYIDGEDLASLLRRIGRLPESKALEIAGQLCQGLGAAHDQNILHRDLKPRNLMIDGRGRARITDFGIATLAESFAGQSACWGTPAYMAPEQLAGREATTRSDLYALGLILYELFTGRPAFLGQTLEQRRGTPEQGGPVPPSRLVEGLEPAIEEAILTCLDGDPHRRPATAEEVALALGVHGASPAWQPAAGREIPHRSSWLLEKKLGEGGFGQVWLARHRKTRDLRVFKFCQEIARLHALQREITVFRLLKEELGDRDDIARILDWSFDEAPYFIESEYTEGGDLLAWARQQGGLSVVPLATRLEIVAQVATALAAAHSVGVLHKDVKPTNVLIARDRVAGDRVAGTASGGDVRALLTDFGLGSVLERQRLAKAEITVAGLSEKTKEGTGGTRLYMAPELLEGKAATLQSDIFALGVMLYQAVLGDFSRALAPGWWRDVDDALLREDIAEAVDGAPERRLGDARELARRLRALTERQARRASEHQLRAEARLVQQALERSRRRRRLGALIIGALAVVAAGMGLLAGQIARQAAKAKNIARIAVAGEWIREDPTRAALVLLEVEDPDQTSYAVAQMRRVLGQKLATVELRGHRGPILSAAWSASGDRVVTVSKDRTVRVWSVDGSVAPTVISLDEPILTAWLDPGEERVVTFSAQGTARGWGLDGSGGAVIFDIRDHNVQVVAASPDGDWVVTGSWSGRVRLWSTDGAAADSAAADSAAADSAAADSAAESGTTEPVALADHGGPVTGVAFSRHGDRVVTASQDGTARVWWLDSSVDPIVLDHQHALLNVTFDATGDRVLTASAAGIATVWQLGGETEPVVFEMVSASIASFDVAWSPHGDRIALAAAGTVRVASADGKHNAVISTDHADDAMVAFSPTGEQVLIASASGVAELWNVDGSGEPIALKGHSAGVNAVFSPRGDGVLTYSRDGTGRIWSVAPPVEPAVLRHSDAVRIAAWNRSGERLATASEDGAVRVWGADGSRDAVLARGLGVAVEAVAWNPVDDRLLIGSRDGTVRLWPAEADADPATLFGPAGSVSVAVWSRSGDRLAIGSQDGTVRVWRAGGEPVVLGPGPGPVIAAAWHPDERQLMTVTGLGSEVWLWDLDDWNFDDPGDPRVLWDQQAAIETVAFSPSGDRLVTLTDDGTVTSWRLDGSREPVWQVEHEDFVFAAAFSVRGELLTATSEGTVRMFRGDSDQSLIIQSHQSAVFAVSWSPSGDRFVTASEDGTARVWRADSFGDSAILEGHTGQIMDVAWSPRGDRIVTVSLDGTARLWRVETSDLVSALASATGVCLEPEFRQQALGDSPRSALASYDDCALAQTVRGFEVELLDPDRR